MHIDCQCAERQAVESKRQLQVSCPLALFVQCDVNNINSAISIRHCIAQLYQCDHQGQPSGCGISHLSHHRSMSHQDDISWSDWRRQHGKRGCVQGGRGGASEKSRASKRLADTARWRNGQCPSYGLQEKGEAVMQARHGGGSAVQPGKRSSDEWIYRRSMPC